MSLCGHCCGLDERVRYGLGGPQWGPCTDTHLLSFPRENEAWPGNVGLAQGMKERFGIFQVNAGDR